MLSVEDRERIHRNRLAGFAEGLRYHLANGPETWTVRKACERCWHVVNGAGDVVTSAKTRREAQADLTSGPYFRIWHDADAWYRGTSRDPRNRKFTDEEQAIIDGALPIITTDDRR
jgi:hypothetical protein